MMVRRMTNLMKIDTLSWCSSFDMARSGLAPRCIPLQLRAVVSKSLFCQFAHCFVTFHWLFFICTHLITAVSQFFASVLLAPGGIFGIMVVFLLFYPYFGFDSLFHVVGQPRSGSRHLHFLCNPSL